MRMFGGGPTAEIVRLDEGKIYQLDLEKTTFAEMSLAEQLRIDIADAPGFAQRLEYMFGAYQGIWSEITAKMDASEGYPMRSGSSLRRAVELPPGRTLIRTARADAEPVRAVIYTTP